MEIRRLTPREREAWLDLLDGWELSDGWHGSRFFRRPLDHDPGYDDAQVWVAAEAGRLLATVQIFPRQLRVHRSAVPTGGVGSVYTRPERRGEGIASRLLERCLEDMRERGMELSLLFAARIPFYERLGWRSWRLRRELLRLAPDAKPQPAAVEIGPFDAEGDLPAVAELHRASAARWCGVAERRSADWRASLALAGNPVEEFQVARAAPGAAPLAYLRSIRLEGTLVFAEYGQRDAGALAALLRAALAPREADALAPPGVDSARFRSRGVLAMSADPALAASLHRVGIERVPVEDPTVMLRCLDPDALGRRLGLARRSDEADGDFLRRALPPERFGYWPSDRF